MDDDIRLAFLGDKAAQEHVTERGELLPCPCCKGVAVWRYSSGPYYMFNVRVKCESCGHQTVPAFYGNNGTIKIEEANEYGKEKAVRLVTKRWNTRALLLTPAQLALLKIGREPRIFEEENHES